MSLSISAGMSMYRQEAQSASSNSATSALERLNRTQKPAASRDDAGGLDIGTRATFSEKALALSQADSESQAQASTIGRSNISSTITVIAQTPGVSATSKIMDTSFADAAISSVTNWMISAQQTLASNSLSATNLSSDSLAGKYLR